MKKIILAVAALVATSSVMATPVNYKYVAANQESATQLCVIAANEGIEASKEASVEMGVSFYNFNKTMTCNGLRLKSFISKINKVNEVEEEIQVVATKKVKMISTDIVNIEESEVCIKAAKDGMKKAQRSYAGDATGIVCNGLSIRSFAKKYKKVDIL
jgi:hypothetical protein